MAVHVQPSLSSRCLMNAPSSTMSEGRAETPMGSFQRDGCCAGSWGRAGHLLGVLRRQRGVMAAIPDPTWGGLGEQPPSFGSVVIVNKAPVEENGCSYLFFFLIKCVNKWFCICLTCHASFLRSSSFLVCLLTGPGCPLGVIAFILQHGAWCPPDKVF